MSVEDLEKAIVKLSSRERTRLLKLLEEMDAAEFDAGLEADIRAGKLDKLAQEALEDVKARRFHNV